MDNPPPDDPRPDNPPPDNPQQDDNPRDDLPRDESPPGQPPAGTPRGETPPGKPSPEGTSQDGAAPGDTASGDTAAGDAAPGSAPPRQGGAVDRILGGLRRVSRFAHYASGAAIVGLMLLTVVDITGRQLFNRPLPGTVELTEMAMILIAYLGFAHAEHEGDHIAVDIVYTRLRRGAQVVLRVFNGLFSLAVVGLMTWELYRFASTLDQGGYSTGVLEIPQAPVALAGAAGGVLFLLAIAAGVVQVLRGQTGGHTRDGGDGAEGGA